MYADARKRRSLRSRLDPEVRQRSKPSTASPPSAGSAACSSGPARPTPDSRDLLAVALFGYELAPERRPATPPERAGRRRRQLRSEGCESGDVIRLGPARTPVEVVGFVSDTQYSGQATPVGVARHLAGGDRGQPPAPSVADDVVQALGRAHRRSGDGVAEVIDDATGGATTSSPMTAAIDAIPGVSQQRTTFNQIIGVTVVIAVVVVALFFVLLTVERSRCTACSRPSALQLAPCSAVSSSRPSWCWRSSPASSASARHLPSTPPSRRARFRSRSRSSRLVASGLLMLAAALVGVAFSLRRVLRIDPASAIGGSIVTRRRA